MQTHCHSPIFREQYDFCQDSGFDLDQTDTLNLETL